MRGWRWRDGGPGRLEDGSGGAEVGCGDKYMRKRKKFVPFFDKNEYLLTFVHKAKIGTPYYIYSTRVGKTFGAAATFQLRAAK